MPGYLCFENFQKFLTEIYYLMSGRQYYRDLLLKCQDKIRGLGATIKNRWAAFCYAKSMTMPEFAKKMQEYNIQFQGNDINVIWDSIGLAPDMNFTEFLKFMETDVDEFNPVGGSRGRTPPSSNPGMPQARDMYETPAYGGSNDGFGSRGYGYNAAPQPTFGGNADDLIHENLRDIIISCMSKDSLMTGEVSRNAFIDVCGKYGISDTMPGFSKILSIGDASGSGLIQYFTVASRICSDSQSTNASFGRGSYGGGYDAPEPAPICKAAMHDNLSLGDTGAPQRKSAYMSSISLNDNSNSNLDAQPRPRKFALEESNVWGDAPAKTPTQQRQSLPMGGPRPTFSPYNGPSGGNPDDVLATISQKVTEGMGNSSAAFNKWRGYNTKLTAADLCKGLQRDCGYSAPYDVVQEIMDRYGGDLNLTSFVRLMGDGAQMSERASNSRPRATFTPPNRKMTEDEQTIEDIAAQFVDKDFSAMTAKARNAEDLCIIFQRAGIQFDEARVKKLVSKQGKNGFVDSILQHLGQ